MRHQNRKKRLDRPVAHRRSLLRNLTTSLILHEKLKTTVTKAKVLRREVDHLITMAKKKDEMNAIRMLKGYLFTEAACKKMMALVKDRFTARNSGYTRISPVEFRKGDNAKIVLIELV